MRKEVVVLGLCFLLSGLMAGAQVFRGQPISFNAIKALTLYNTAGERISIQPAKEPLCLFVMLSPECPLCKNYSLVLNTLHQRYGKDLQVYGIVPGKAYANATLKQFAADYKIGFPLLVDKAKKLSGYLQATVTPEVILTDGSGAIVYRGAIDDWVTELGKKKTAPQEHYLEQAIVQYLSGEPVQLSSTIAKGCLINEF